MPSGVYPGVTDLTPNTTLHWSVRVWDGEDQASAYSVDATFAILDIGLRAFDGAQVIRIAVDNVSSSYPLRIHKNGATYGIVLVDVSDPDASKFRIQTSAGMKAIKKM